MTNEGFNSFKRDLYVGFMNYEGFSEFVYSRNYNNNITLQDEVNQVFGSTSQTPVRSTTAFTANTDSASTVRSSSFGNSSENAIFINDDTSTTQVKI
jgi:hypothetical protein